ncbi:hypothetical protein EVAR_18796_1 [Eumeta japonica]|uniref:Uncharacterized protein n=1 Tax=Eumeta variegata TaxID=151549 RepID=A0A4C1ULH9_EUMVA|nr:hypothetical protein EVAR_18796_1 [Eumeta japonica]
MHTAPPHAWPSKGRRRLRLEYSMDIDKVCSILYGRIDEHRRRTASGVSCSPAGPRCHITSTALSNYRRLSNKANKLDHSRSGAANCAEIICQKLRYVTATLGPRGVLAQIDRPKRRECYRRAPYCYGKS